MRFAIRPTQLRVLGACASFLSAGVAFALLWPHEQVSAAPLPVQLRVMGQPADPSADPVTQARNIARHYLTQPVVIVADDVQQHLTRAELGGLVDVTRLAEWLEAAADPTSPMRKVHAQELPGKALDLPLPLSLDVERAIPLLVALKDRIDRAPVNARLDTRTSEVVASQEGLELDVYATLDSIDAALENAAPQITAVVHHVKPKRTRDTFDGISMNAVLSEFETRYNAADTAADRTHNLKVAAAKIDGYVLRPGETFDFNAIVGDRTEINGFKAAPVIAGGELVDGLGGGTCQVASTLHGAVFFAGLPIVTRHAHSRPSFYVKMGLDAAVAYGSLNFVFKNDYAFPIVIGIKVEGGIAHAQIRGHEQTRKVTFLRRIDSFSAFGERTSNDSTIPQGLRVLSQRGVPGFSLTSFRVIEDVRTHTSTRERFVGNYPSTTQTWRIGNGPEAEAGYQLPPNDSHPEYVADETMWATAGPGVNGYEQSRDPGRSGTYGWTVREGLAPASR